MKAWTAASSEMRSSGRKAGDSRRRTAMRRTATSIWMSGSGVETAQSLPKASRAPARRSEPNGYCQPARCGADEGDRQDVHLGLVDGPQRLAVGDDAERREAWHVRGMDDLDVGDGRSSIPARVGGDGRFDGIQPLADGQVADGVTMDVEPSRVGRSHDRSQLVRIEQRQAAVGGRPAVRTEVRLEQGGGVVLDHAIEEELDPVGAQPADGVASLRRSTQGLELVQPTVVMPMLGDHDATGQAPASASRR